MTSFNEARRRRFRFLHRLYETTRGDTLTYVNCFELGEELGFDRDQTLVIIQRLFTQGFVHARALRSISITHMGVVEVERALRRPDQPTPNFPPVNTMSIGQTEKESRDHELASLRRQLAEEKENLLLIQERKAEYVMDVAISLDLVKQERRTRKRIEELERRIEELEQPKPRSYGDRPFPVEVAETVEAITLEYEDVSMTADAFDLFWRKYSLVEDLRRRMRVKRTDKHSLIEYSLCAKAGESHFAPYGRIEMRTLPGKKQKLTQRIVKQWTPSDGPSLFSDNEPVVTDEEMEGIFQAFIAYLHDEGYLDTGKSEPTPIQDAGTSAGGKVLNIGRLIDMTKSKIVKVMVMAAISIVVFLVFAALSNYLLLPLLPEDWQTTLIWLVIAFLATIGALAGLAEFTGYSLKDILSPERAASGLQEQVQNDTGDRVADKVVVKSITPVEHQKEPLVEMPEETEESLPLDQDTLSKWRKAGYRENPSPREIEDRLHSLPPYQRDVVKESYIGQRVMWHGILDNVGIKQGGTVSIWIRPDERAPKLCAFGEVDIAEHPRLKIAKEGERLWIAGEIRSISAAVLFFLSNCMIMFD